MGLGCAPDQTRADRPAADQVTEAEHRERAQELYRAFETRLQAEDPDAALAGWSEDVRIDDGEWRICRFMWNEQPEPQG